MIDLEAQKKHFRNHVAEFTDLGTIKIIDFRNPESGYYYIRFLFDEDICTLHISGDLGDLTASNYSNMTYEGFKDFVQNAPYFTSKVDCCSRRIFEYNEDKAYDELKEHIEKYEIDCTEDYDSIDECIRDVLHDFSSERGISEYGYDVLNNLDSDCWEWCSDLGKESSGIIELYLLAFELASAQLKN